MEKTDSTRHIAIVENCSMSAVGLQHLFAMSTLSQYQLHLFSEFDGFKNALHHVNFFSLIYSLSDAREERRNCLAHRVTLRLRMVIFSASYWSLTRWKHGLLAIFRLHACTEWSVNR